jgi:hypothetical protein
MVTIDRCVQASIATGASAESSALCPDGRRRYCNRVGRYERRRAMPSFATTVTVQRLSVPDPSSFTEQTTPVTVDPIRVNVASRPEYWA